ncbi:MAG: OmpH family outer membrane protein [Alistipes sp.]|jgi:outer membrane protein|nr:OmpH family outer membrane protein [Alistipes sp.]MBQ2415212.1 OmpH family outer membrane protein [Alistipes sp.]MBQ5622521.1 OmpH family outer membrane protein [Alistipes sp.]MBQ5785043.1 OmpH family outer membrane protein [Alistipes sp.]MBQ5913659.1 OmpH family outer membrane protein [Alistipes sp.]
MKNLFLTLLVAVVALVACDNTKTANTTAEGEAAQTEVIGGGDLAYVRVDYVLAQSEIYKTEGVALQEKTQKAQNSWAQKEKNLQLEAAQLQEKYQKGLITTADAQKQQQSIEKRATNFQTNTQKEAQTLDEENYVFQNRTTDLIMRAIKEVNADGKYKMIVNATSLLDAAESLDISETVLAKVNEMYAAEKNNKTEATTEKK